MTTAANVDEALNVASPQDQQNPPTKSGINRRLLIFGVLALSVAVALCYWLYARNY